MAPAVASPPLAARAASLARRRAVRWVAFRPVAALSTSCAASPDRPAPQLVLYTKPGCCLCDGLKEKLHAALALGGPHSLHAVQLEVRNILANPEWEKMYQYEIPVLARVLPDGTEVTLPRLSPRLGAELIQKKIVAALGQ